MNETLLFSLSTLPSTSATIPPIQQQFKATVVATHNSAKTTTATILSNLNATNLEELNADPCEYVRPVYLEERFWLVTVVGTSVALISVVENLFLFFILTKKKSNRNSHCLYLILLAFFDVFMGAAYVPLMSLSLLLDYLESVFLLRSWYSYMTPLITTSHIAMTSSSFLILAASFERFCITCWTKKVKKVHKYRCYIAIAAIFLGFFTKITLAGEFEIIFNGECAGTMLEYSLKLSSLALDYYYNLFWRLGFRNVVTVLLPFFLLLIMNLKIVTVLRNSAQIQSQNINETQRKHRVRAATRTLLMLVFTYLMANVLNVLLTFWEYIDIRSLTGPFIAFYTFGVDTVSILTILAGALRLPIYVSCMPQLRREIYACFKRSHNAAKNYKKQLNMFGDTSKAMFLGANFNSNVTSSFCAPSILTASEMLLKLPILTTTTTTSFNPTISHRSNIQPVSSSDDEYDENEYGEWQQTFPIMNDAVRTCAAIASSTSYMTSNTCLPLDTTSTKLGTNHFLVMQKPVQPTNHHVTIRSVVNCTIPSLNVIPFNSMESGINLKSTGKQDKECESYNTRDAGLEQLNKCNCLSPNQINYMDLINGRVNVGNNSNVFVFSDEQRRTSSSSGYSTSSFFSPISTKSSPISPSTSNSSSRTISSISPDRLSVSNPNSESLFKTNPFDSEIFCANETECLIASVPLQRSTINIPLAHQLIDEPISRRIKIEENSSEIFL